MDIERKSTEFNINNCLKKMLEFDDPEMAINDFLIHIGKKWDCDRAYIFEKISSERFSNTYEWCAEGVESQMFFLQNEPMDLADWWWKLFEDREAVIIPDVEAIKLDSPHVYATLKPQNIDTLVTCGVYVGGELVGFLGVDNPKVDELDIISSFIDDASYLITVLFERRNAHRQLVHNDFYDQLTGIKNRLAFQQYLDNFIRYKRFGLVNCEIIGLNDINKNHGFDKGDEEIIYWTGVLSTIFGEKNVYRIGGDEFMVFCEEISYEKMSIFLDRLDLIINKSEGHLIFGSAWQEEEEDDEIIVDRLIDFAGHILEKKKRDYFQENNISTEVEDKYGDPKEFVLMRDLGDFKKYLDENYFDLFTMMESLSIDDYYFFMGDLDTNVFYISNEMKYKFRFESNIVQEFSKEWGSRIVETGDLIAFQADVENLKNNNLSGHNMRYKVRDRFNNEIWIHSQATIKTSHETGKAVFLSGIATSQENSFIIDPISNLPRENAAILKLHDIKEVSDNFTIIGFTLNNFKEINEIRGRKDTNIFLSNVIKAVINSYGNTLDFYRLDGMRFIGILKVDSEDCHEKYIDGIRKIIEDMYNSYGLGIKYPCSLAILKERTENTSPHEVLANIINLLTRSKLEPAKPYLVFSNENLVYQKEKTRMTMELNNDVLNEFNNFRVVIQPVVDSESQEIISGEVLLRWNFEGKDVPPTSFIPILEKNGMIVNTGMWVLDTACKHILRTIATPRTLPCL